MLRGGGAILDSHIVRIDVCHSHGIWKTLYQAEHFSLPEIVLQPSDLPPYKVDAMIDGDCHARFRTWAEACQWAGFMLGVHHEWPQI